MENESHPFDPVEKEHSLRADSQSWDTSTVKSARPDDIPLIDVSDYFKTESDEDLDAAAEQLGYASRNAGFYSLIGHAVPEETIGDAFEQTKRFHQLPLEQKNASLMDQPESVRNAVRESMRVAISDHYLDGYVELPANCWLVTARNPA